MDDLMFCLNATMPLFLMMVLGYFFHRVGMIDTPFANQLNSFVFKAALPILLFQDMSESDFFAVWDTKFVLFCLLTTGASIAVSAIAARLLIQPETRGEFVQASYRSSAALLGIALIVSLYGNAGAGSLMLIGAVPLYNVAAVLSLQLLRPGVGGLDRTVLKRTLLGVVKNPIILGIVIGFLWSILKLPQPVIMQKAVSSFAATATPLGLIAMGASFDPKKATGALRPALLCSALKLVVFVAVFLPLAVFLGFRADKLVAILVMLGAATTVSCFVMARNLGYEGTLTINTVMLTTFLSAFTLTGWLYLIRSLGLI